MNFVRSALALAVFSGPVYAADCSPAQLREVTTVSANIAQEFVEAQFLGGKNITPEIVGCAFEEADQGYDVDLKINWEGVLMSWNKYEISGRLTYEDTGGEVNFTAISANEKVQELKFWGNVANKGISLAKN